ncbi:MAG TPA: hypothetical protein VEZ24_11575 [Microvirga sp.]|nr:hypothetical protein [Microvirga sp.]
MKNDDAEFSLEIVPPSPARDRLAQVMDWVGLSAAIGMLVTAVVIGA